MATLAEQHWIDRKRYLWIISAVLPALPLVSLGLWSVTGNDWTLWLTLGVVYLLFPALDLLMGDDRSNPPEASVAALEADPWYRRLVYSAVPLVYATLIAGTWFAVSMDLGPVGYLGLALSVGWIGGAGINVGHELGHKKAPADRWMARIALAASGYGHFQIEHVRGHHRDVATPEDSASSRLGESYYRFMSREIPGGFRRAWRLETERLGRQGRRPWTPGNEILQTALITLVVFGGLVVWLGWQALPFLLLQAAFAYTLLSAANYVEHYGLLRERVTGGRYERPQPCHSWNSNHTVSNLMLYQLQRHSDHHAHPTRGYQALRHFDEAPQLPTGYFGMFLVALVPPLWRRIMDPRVLAHAGGDLARINVDPGSRHRYATRHGTAAA
jgi:alkane 1-monooxygenase